MRTISSSGRHHYLKRTGIFLIVVALIAGIIGCADGGDETEPTLDHFRVYNTGEGQAPYLGEVVDLEDQFGSFTATVGWGPSFGNPVEKVHDGVTTPISDPDHHLMGYWLEDVESQWWRVTVSNQFGEQELIVYGPNALTVPAQKEGHDAPVGHNCYLGYQVIEGPSVEVVVGLSDQFGNAPQSLVLNPINFGNPVQLTHDGEVTEIVNPDEHFVAYIVLDDGASTGWQEVVVTDQFGQYTLNLFQGEEAALVVPSDKITWEPL